MNKALLLLCFLLTSIQSFYANDILLLEIAGARRSENDIISEENGLIEQKAQFLFDDDKGVFLFGNDCGLLLFKIADIERLRKIFEKYLNWEEIAVFNKVKIYKDIPESLFATEIVYDKTSRGDYIKESIFFKMVFYSVNEKEHFLIIDSGRKEKNNFCFLDEPFYIGKSEVLELYSSITEEKIEQYIEKYKDKEKVKELFK